MSPIGRLFIVLNLVLAGVFLGSSAAFLASGERYRTDYEKEVVARATLKEELDREIADQKAALAEAQRQREDMRNAKAALETQKESLDQDIAAKTDELNQLKAQVANWDDSVSQFADQVQAAVQNSEQANEARLAAVEARNEAQQARAEAEAAQASAEDRVNELEDAIQGLNADLASVRRDLQDKETSLAKALAVAGLTLKDIGDAAPPINGAVLGVDSVGGSTIVHINRGQADNVKAGYVFEIFNAGTYKGQARVEIVHGSSCTARMITAREGAAVSQGDRASTQIGG